MSSDKEGKKEEHSENIRNFIKKLLEETKLTPYQLSMLIGSNETLLQSFLNGRTQTLNSGALVQLADFATEALGREVSLDEIVGRDFKELPQEVNVTKDTNIFKDTQALPVIFSQLSNEAQQDVMRIKEEAQKFMHNTNPPQGNFLKQVIQSLDSKKRSR